MKIDNFNKFISENKDVENSITIEFINDCLVHIKDLGFKIYINDKEEIYPHKGEFENRYYISVRIDANVEKDPNGFMGNKIFELLEEVTTLRYRLNCLINLDRNFIFLRIFTDKTNIDNKELELKKLRSLLRDRVYSGKTDFYHSITTDITDNEVILNINREYTDRKLANMIKDIDLSKFEMTKKVNTNKGIGMFGNYNLSNAIVTFKYKE
jgi:hypothetical protein